MPWVIYFYILILFFTLVDYKELKEISLRNSSFNTWKYSDWGGQN